MPATRLRASALKMPKITSQIIGNLDQWEQVVNAKLASALGPAGAEVAIKVAATARQLCPYDETRKSGTHLRDTIRVQVAGKDNLKNSIANGRVFTTVRTNHAKAPHDFIVHNGTVRSRPNTFLFSAADQHAPEIREAMQKAVREMDQ